VGTLRFAQEYTVHSPLRAAVSPLPASARLQGGSALASNSARTRINTGPKTPYFNDQREFGLSCRGVKTFQETEPSKEAVVTARRSE
jgi:hypothetical protein